MKINEDEREREKIQKQTNEIIDDRKNERNERDRETVKEKSYDRIMTDYDNII